MVIKMNRNEIAVIICNYNGKEDTVKCIDAVIGSKGVSCDIYVIDNASTDDSVDLIRQRFCKNVSIIQNPKNLGGAGGFGRGLRMALEMRYVYIMMLDNDAFVDTDTIYKLRKYLKENPDVGIVGAKIMMTDDPERIMDYAKTIDFERFTDGSKWCGELDSNEAQEARECDFAAATAAMTRWQVLEQCGGMDEAHFIYYDDIELGYRIKKHGYKVISLGSAKAWHISGMRRKTNTFARYYLTRNQYRFFAKYIPEEDIERFTEHILSHAFAYMYGSYYKGRIDIFDTEKYILEDFIRDRRGEAGERRVNELQKDGYHLVEKELAGCKNIVVYISSEVSDERAARFREQLCGINPEAEIMMKTVTSIRDTETKQEEFTKLIYFCKHVKDAERNILPALYIDIYGNMIANEQDYFYFRNYEKNYGFFRAIYHDSIIETIQRIRMEG